MNDLLLLCVCLVSRLACLNHGFSAFLTGWEYETTSNLQPSTKSNASRSTSIHPDCVVHTFFCSSRPLTGIAPCSS